MPCRKEAPAVSKTIVDSAGALVAEAVNGVWRGTSNAKAINKALTDRVCLNDVLLAEVCSVLMIPHLRKTLWSNKPTILELEGYSGIQQSSASVDGASDMTISVIGDVVMVLSSVLPTRKTALSPASSWSETAVALFVGRIVSRKTASCYSVKRPPLRTPRPCFASTRRKR